MHLTPLFTLLSVDIYCLTGMKKKVKLKIMSHQLKQKLFILLGEQLFLFTTKRFAGTAGRLSTAINMKAVIVMIISRALQ